MTAGVHLRKRNSGNESQGTRRQEELMVGKPPVVNNSDSYSGGSTTEYNGVYLEGRTVPVECLFGRR
jgi:hypothetical protein